MLAVNFLLLTFAAFSTAWTVDLPEVRRQKFENNENNNHEKIMFKDKKIFSNIEADSPLNTDRYEKEKYADGYEYQSYREKQIDGIVHSGSVYLEGLRRSIDKFIENLQKCTALEEMEKTKSLSESTEDIDLLSRACEYINQASHQVRHMAELAMVTTKELQDRAYDAEYDHKHKHSEEMENELVLKLAWFLDQLAQLTGYKPDAKDYVKDNKEVETPTATPPSMMLVPEDIKIQILRCLKNEDKSKVPATIRCNFPLQTNPEMTRMMNFTVDFAKNAAIIPGRDASQETTRMIETLLTAEDRQTPQIDSKRQKRSPEEHPAVNLMKYYVKHKVWVNSNPDPQDGLFFPRQTNFEVGNEHPGTESKNIVKRSAIKKLEHFPEHHEIFIHHEKHHEKKPIHHIKEHIVDKLKLHLHKIHLHHDKVAHKLDKLVHKIHKRSTNYSQKKYPYIPEDPQQDISFYVKNKKGTNYSNNPVQKAQVRAGLEQAFQTGNILVIRRFGSNYNPANPRPLMTGAAISLADA